MKAFKDLGDIYFDRAFTLDPFPFLAEIYADNSLKGFHSCGMNFLIKHQDANVLLLEHDKSGREPLMSEDLIAREMRLAEKYPQRAFLFQHGIVDVRAKAMLMKFIGQLIDRIDFKSIAPVFSRLAIPGLHNNYLEEIKTLPMRVLLDAWGLPYDDIVLEKLYFSGTTFVKSFDNYFDEDMIALGNEAERYVYEYSVEVVNNPPPDSLIAQYIQESRERGVDVNNTIGSLMTFINSVGNTLAITTAYMIRNAIRYPEVIASLKAAPDLMQRDSTVLEFLRRDNHVKSLSRQIHQGFDLNGMSVKPGEAFYLFYPGINLDPVQWHDPLRIDLDRSLDRDKHVIFGGSRYTCIGIRITLVYMKAVLAGIVASLPPNIRVLEDQVTIEDGWIAERVISCMPIEVG
jgi:hypothetical protein